MVRVATTTIIFWLVAGATAAQSRIEIVSPTDAVPSAVRSDWWDVTAGRPLHLRCTGPSPIAWSLPYLWALSPLSPNNTWEQMANISHRCQEGQCTSELLIPHTTYDMTGNFSCSSSAIYLFFNDPEHLVVPYEGTTDYLFLALFQSQPSVIPCRATYSQAEVTLWKTTTLGRDQPPEPIKINASLGVTFDPTRGFLFEHPRWDVDTNVLICHFRVPAIEREANSTVSMHWSILPSELDPIIDDSQARHVFLHDTFSLRCFVHIDLGVILMLDWDAPNKNDPSAAQRVFKSEAETTPQVVNQNVYHTVSVNITVVNATQADQGPYRCVATDGHGRTFSATKRVAILDPDALTTVNLTAEFDPEVPLMVDAGQPVHMSVLADAWPDISLVELQWLKDGQPLASDSRLQQQRQETSHTTRISLLIEATRAADSGTYTLVANATDSSSMVSAILYVTGEPELVVTTAGGEPRDFYVLNVSYQLTCHRYGYPSRPVWWSWWACGTPESCLESKLPSLESWLNVTAVESDRPSSSTLPYLNASTLTVTAVESGWYRCWSPLDSTAGSLKHHDLSFIVMDAESLLAITASTEEPTVNDTMRLTCKASVFRYVQLWWTNGSDDGGPLQADSASGVRLISHSNQYSISSTLEWPAIQGHHSGVYTCEAVPRFDARQVDRVEWHLRVQNMSAPRWLDTNLGHPEPILIQAGYNGQAELRCVVKGRPRPRVYWFRNGFPLRFDGHDSGLRLEQDGQRLLFTRLLEKDSGLYECRATNRAGMAFRKALLQVSRNDDEFDVPAIELLFSLLFALTAAVLIGTACLLGHRLRRPAAPLGKGPFPYSAAAAAAAADDQHGFEHGRMELFDPAVPLDEQTDLLPYDPRFEFPKERLVLGRTLGQGAFGRVVMAEAVGLADGPVAVKMLKERADANQRKALMAELKILVHLGRHLNIVNLLGAVTKNLCRGELLLIVEYCELGNLRHYLLANRDRFVDQLDRPTDAEYRNVPPLVPAYYNHNYVGTGTTRPGTTTVTTTDLICWAFQCARGMDYLTMRKLIHRDLAARNVLLASNNVVKICDFGLAKDVYKYDNYVKKDDGPLPIKWMAIESISDKVFTSKSDVWSYGILLWELFTLGKNPYPGIEIDEEFYKRLKNGYRMEKPDLASEHLYQLMLRCWNADPGLRPDFGELADLVGDLLDDQTKKHYIELNNPYLEMNQQILGNNDYLKMTAMTSGQDLETEEEEEGGHYEQSKSTTDLIELALLDPDRPSPYQYDNLAAI